jgi:hypothetical protein
MIDLAANSIAARASQHGNSLRGASGLAMDITDRQEVLARPE